MRRWGWSVAALCLAGTAAGAAGNEAALSARMGGARAVVIQFAEPMQTMTMQDGAQYATFAPALPVTRCLWDSDTQLRCELSDEAPKATRFNATLSQRFRTLSGEALPTRTLTFETSRPSVASHIESWESGIPHIAVWTTQATSQESLASALRLTIDGKRVPVKLRLEKSYREHNFALEIPPVHKESTLVLSVVPGLLSVEGPLRGQQDAVLQRAIVGEPFQVRGAACAGASEPVVAPVRDGRIDLRGCAPSEQIRILWSREPNKDHAFAAWARSWPDGVRTYGSGREHTRRDANDETAQRATGFYIALGIEAPHRVVDFEIPAISSGEATLRTRVVLHVETGAPRPAFVAPFTRALLERGADPGLQAVNTPAMAIDTVALGRGVVRTQAEAPPAVERGAPIALPTMRDALAEGGFASVMPHRIGDDGARRSGLRASAPDFDVYARHGRRAVLVWANAWEVDAPVADADATLWFDDHAAPPRIVARARTNDEGLALLRLPEDFVLPEHKEGEPSDDWYVRVERGRRAGAERAVLPLHSRAWYELGKLGDAPDTMAWGVVDRPLYRAGDTVHWTLWLRDDMGDHHVAPRTPQRRKLLFRSQHGDVPILAWEQVFDAAGEATGETRIPIHVPDGDYCVESDDEEEGGVCFHVGTFRTQDLWVRGSTTQRLLQARDTFVVDFESGYYSGGETAGIALSNVEATLTRGSPANAYPQWKDFEFADSDAYSYDLVGLDELEVRTDDKGRATLRLPLAESLLQQRIPFGTLSMSAEGKPEDREGTTSNPVTATYAAYPRYVGLKLVKPHLDAMSPVEMQGIVIDAAGNATAVQRIDVKIGYRKEYRGETTPVHACSLVPGIASDCTFPRTRSGYYIITASSDHAASASVRHYVRTNEERNEEQPRLTIDPIELEKTRAGMPIRLQVDTPVFPVRALVYTWRGKDVIDQRVVRLDAATQEVEVPTAADGPRELVVGVVVRRAKSGEAAPLPAGFRLPLEILSATRDISLQEPEVPAPVTLAFEPVQAAPADTVRLVLRNDGKTARKVTLAIVDDALRALGAEWLERMDPEEAGFRLERTFGDGDASGFHDWNTMPLRWLLMRRENAEDCVGRALGACAITVVGNGAFNPIDVSSVESTAILTAEQIASLPVQRDLTSVALLAPGTVRSRAQELGAVDAMGDVYAAAVAAPPLPAAPEEPPVVFDEPSPVDVQSAPKSDRRKGAAPRPGNVSPAEYGAALARVRTNFADTLMWRNGIELAPGASKSIDVVVPDNLTRWRAIAWSHDDRDDFAMAQATLDAGLPLEARLQSPVRIYPGDTSRLAANVRQVADHASQAELRITIAKGEKSTQQATSLAVPANGQASFGTTIAPTSTGALLVTAAAATPEGRDAVAAPIEVASTTVLGTKTQAGWVGDTPIMLELPVLPAGAHDAQVDVSVWRGASSLVHSWTEDLRVYEHRCWEQVLSRAVAAALAIERGDTSWPDAKAVVKEALENAAVFQTESGGMRYFTGETDSPYADENSPHLVPLTAYTVDAFALLQSLGHAVPGEVDAKARTFLAGNDWNRDNTAATENEHAIAASVVDLSKPRQDALPASFAKLSLPARVAAARAFARTNAPNTREAFDTLLAAAPQRGEARSLARNLRFDRWMSSPMREQCELIRLLEDYPQYAPAGARRALIAGLSDLYAGGVAKVDTQTGAVCLRALRKEGDDTTSRIVVDATVGARSERIAVDAGETRAAHAFAMDANGGGALSVAPVERPDAPIAFLARVEYQEDARKAQESSMGFGITRVYETKRDGKWIPADAAGLREGDWVRITLTVGSGAPRWFVAVTDDLPGGLRPIDMDLAGVSGVNTDGEFEGWVFDQRKLDPRQPKFYAQYMPPGRHEIRYFARVANTGDYLAAPAVVELMYGEASRARTASDRLQIADP